MAFLYSNALRLRVMRGELPPWLLRHRRRNRIVQVIYATPVWCDRKAMRRLEATARRRTRNSVEPWRLDHIVPVCHPLVCGLNVPANIRIIRERENWARGNRWSEYTPDMFTQPEQLTLNWYTHG